MDLFAPKKKPRIPPLTPKDIIVAEIDCRESIDRTQQYRTIIARKNHPLDISSEEDSEVRARTETERLKLFRVDNLGVPYELQKQMTQQARLAQQFTSLDVSYGPDTNVHEMIERMQKRVVFYTDKESKTANALENMYDHFHSSTVEGRVSIDKATSTSDILYAKIVDTRVAYKQIRETLVDNSLNINRRSTINKNIESVLEIVEIWKTALVGKLSVFQQKDTNKNISQVFKAIDEMSQSFKTQAKDYKNYGCFLKMEQFIMKKKEAMIKAIEEDYQRRILNFDQQKYPKIIENYQVILKQSLIPKKTNLLGLLDKNISQIVKNTFASFSRTDLNTLTNEEYTQFFVNLTSQIEKYCRNWHLATRWHVEYQNSEDIERQTQVNEQGKEHLRFRKTIFQKIQERISDLIVQSSTFYKLTLSQRGVFVLKLYKLIKEMSLFARQTPKILGDVLKKKCKEQRLMNEKAHESWLRMLIVGELKTNIFEQQHQARPFPTGDLQEFQDEQRKIIEDFSNNKLVINFEQTQEPLIVNHHKAFEINYPPLPTLSQYSSTFLICQFTKQITKRMYFNPKTGVDMFMKLKEMFQIQVISLYCCCCPINIQKQIQEDWSKFSSLKFTKYDDIENNMAKLQSYEVCHYLQSEYYQLSVQIPSLLNKYPINQAAASISPTIESKGQIVQNISVALKWVQENLNQFFVFEVDKKHKELIQQEFRLLELLIKELVNLIYSSSIENTKARYQNLTSTVKDLKWEIKKYNQQTSELFKGYKNNYFGVLESQILPLRALKIPVQMKVAMQTSLVNDFFKALMDAYSKVQKINSNGRQLMRLDVLQLEERVKGLGILTDNSYVKYLIKFIELGYESDTGKLQSSIKANLVYFPFRIWKPLLVSCKASDQISFLDRRDIQLRLAQHYLTLVSSKTI